MKSEKETIFEEIIKQAKSVIRLALYRYGDYLDDKEDILQECHLQIWRLFDTISSITNISQRNSYIFQCCQHVCLHRKRKMKRYEYKKISPSYHNEEDDDDTFEEYFFKTECTPESILNDFEHDYFFNQLQTTKLLLKILKI